MVEHNFIQTPNVYSGLNDQQQFRLNKINEIKDYFVAEIKERELISKMLSEYIASFDYCDKSLIVLPVTTGSISVTSFATVWIANASFSPTFPISTGIVKNLLKTTRNNVLYVIVKNQDLLKNKKQMEY